MPITNLTPAFIEGRLAFCAWCICRSGDGCAEPGEPGTWARVRAGVHRTFPRLI